MKTLYKNIKGRVCTLLLACCSLWAVSCDDDVNDWSVDPNYEGLFRPLTFETAGTTSTATLLTYSKIVSAEKYIFEFYADSCQFLAEDYVRTDTILADTLTVFADSDSPMSVQYRTWFMDFYGSTQYSVRMRGIGADGLESGYVETAFLTPAEQLFEDIETTTSSVTLTWGATNNITHLLLFEKNIITDDTSEVPGEGEEALPEYKDPVSIDLTEEDKAACSKTITDLPSGTNFKVQIMNNEMVRGEYIFKTLGLGEGKVITVPQSTSLVDTIDMKQLFLDNEVEGTGNLTLQFEPGGTYVLADWELPAVDNLLITSTTADEENRPCIMNKSIKISSSLQSLAFNYVCLDGYGEASYLMTISKAAVGSVTFEGCAIENVQRSILRCDMDGLKMENITFNDCEISEIGTNGYGMLTTSSKTTEIDRIEITNSTLINMGDQLMDVRVYMNTLTFTNNTLYLGSDMKKELKQLFRFNNDNAYWPKTAVIKDCIFAGPNKGKGLSHGYGDYSDLLDFSDGNYITSDLKEGNKDLIGIIKYDNSSEDLFVDPVNGDFHIKSGAGFAGTGKAGDPRWY